MALYIGSHLFQGDVYGGGFTVVRIASVLSLGATALTRRVPLVYLLTIVWSISLFTRG